jgi:uncharacterized damage-inducible protein DinB
MITADYARTMARYNRWMNDKVYALCARIPDADRKADAGAFFKSIHGTLNHLLLADRVWMGRFVGAPFRPASLAEELYADFDTLRIERARTDRDIEAYADGLDESAVAATLTYTSIVSPAPRSIAMALALAHFFNHQTHHRGQLTTLLSQRGVDPGVTDLMWLDQDRPSAR